MKIMKLSGVLVLLLLLIASCSKENVDEVVQEQENFETIETTTSNGLMSRSSASEDGLELDCITILFPFSLADVEGNEYEVNDESEFIGYLDGSIEIYDFVYPLDVLMEDGTEVQAADALELGELFAECVPGGGWNEDDFPAYLIGEDNSCFSLSYPVNLRKLDGTVVVANDENEFIALTAQEPMFFEFPISLVDEDGNIHTAGNTDELFDILLSCNDLDPDVDTTWVWETGFEYIACYKVEFPMTVKLIDGTEVVVNDHMELCDLMIQGELAGFAYPLTLVDEDGNEIVVNSDDELNEAIEDCFEDDGGNGTGSGDFGVDLLNLAFGLDEVDCYDINYPFSATYLDFENGAEIQVEFSNDDELTSFVEDYMQTGAPLITMIDYPISVVLNADGSTMTLNDAVDVDILVFDICQ